jgi:mRNA (guanine-N7-)-methyltransferase
VVVACMCARADSIDYRYGRQRLDELPPDAEDLSFGNSVYKITFEERHKRPVFGHRYFFFLEDAVEDVPEYVVHWDSFTK